MIHFVILWISATDFPVSEMEQSSDQNQHLKLHHWRNLAINTKLVVQLGICDLFNMSKTVWS